jgi:hypothetical protein
MPIMIWTAALVELIKASTTGDGWPDFVVLLILQFANGMVRTPRLRPRPPSCGRSLCYAPLAAPRACLVSVSLRLACGGAQVGYVEETNAGNAIAALKERLAPECHVCRDGQYVWLLAVVCSRAPLSRSPVPPGPAWSARPAHLLPSPSPLCPHHKQSVRGCPPASTMRMASVQRCCIGPACRFPHGHLTPSPSTRRHPPPPRVGRRWMKMPSRQLVPGDLIELKLGDIVPADAILLEGVPLQVDQAALTGESLPVTIHSDGKVKQGSAVKRGETKAVVCATGALLPCRRARGCRVRRHGSWVHVWAARPPLCCPLCCFSCESAGCCGFPGKYTFFGKAADMINSVEAVGRFQKIVFGITMWLLAASIVLTLVIFVRGPHCLACCAGVGGLGSGTAGVPG